MLESFTKKFNYQKLSEEEQKKRGILGRLVGVIADCTNPTRNERLYSEELWDKVFDNPIMKERIKNHVCYGELGHPLDGRTETDMEKVAICLAEQPKKGDDGKLYGVFDILSTPNGKILKALCDYGSNIGISSRGTGDVITDDDGNEAVDPDTYDCECWDAVLLPAVECARLQLVTESVDTHKSTLTESLNKLVESASDDEKKVMTETLQALKIDCQSADKQSDNIVVESKEVEEDKKSLNENADDTKEEAVNDGSTEIVKSLQEALKSNSSLEEKIAQLRSELAVSNAKVESLTEEAKRYKSVSASLGEQLMKEKKETKRLHGIEEQLTETKKLMDEQKTTISKLTEQSETSCNNEKTLRESMSAKTDELKKLTEKYDAKLNESTKEIERLNRLVESTKSDARLAQSTLKKRLEKSDSLVESYRKLADDMSKKYIASKANMLGVSENAILNRLDEHYTLDDIDEACETLKTETLNISRLPFNVSNAQGMKVRKSTNESITREFSTDGDDVDDSLLMMAQSISNR